MLARRTARWNVLLFVSGLVGPAALSACGDAGSGSEESARGSDATSNLTMAVIAQYEGGYDGEKFWYRPMDITDQGAGGSSGEGIGVARQAIETDQQNQFYVPPTGGAGGAAPQTNAILIEQREFHDETTWPTATCGPTPQHGSCVRWRLFNAFPDQDLFRGYFYLTTLTPPNGCTGACNITVQIPAPSATTQTSVSDPGLLGTTPASGSGGAPGLWRYGLLEHAGPVTRGAERFLAFVGTGSDPANANRWGFHWVGQVRGMLARPTVRASLANNTRDQAPFYTSLGTASAGMVVSTQVQATADGRYAVFSSGSATLSPNGAAAGTKVFRYDMNTGALVTVSIPIGGTNAPAGCTSILPSISSDGNLVVFQSEGCDLGKGTTRQIYLRNITAATTTLVTHDAAGNAGDGPAQSPRIAAGGGFVTFASAARSIFPARPADRNNTFFEVYRYNVSSGAIERANIPTAGPSVWPTFRQYTPDISADGSRVVFASESNNLVRPDDTYFDIFLYDFNAGTISLVSRPKSGVGGAGPCTLPSISADGTTVAYLCNSQYPLGTTPANTIGRRHVYRRTVASAATLQMIDVAPGGLAEGNTDAGAVPPSLTANGDLVGYASLATNLIRTTGCSPGCIPFLITSGNWGAFVRDMGTPDPEVQRSYLVGLIKSKLATSPLPFVHMAGGLGIDLTYGGRTLSVTGARDGAFVFYNGWTHSNTDWSQLPTPGSYQAFVSPFSDALFQ